MSNTTFNAAVGAGGMAFQGDTQYFFDRHHLTFSPIDTSAFPLFQKNLYVAPDSTKDWDTLPVRLADNGLLVLRAPAGTGRRTTALQLLRSVLEEEQEIVELEADWSKPEVRSLPAMEAHGCLLDMSSPSTDKPDARFGQALVEHGQRIQKDGRFLVVLTTPGTWRGSWTEGTRSLTIDLSPPDSHELIRRHLIDHGQEDLVKWLDNEALEEVWQESLTALEALDLALHLSELKDSDNHQERLNRLGNQFTGWGSRIETLLGHRGEFDGIQYGQAVARSVVWAGALLEGCRPQSVIWSSERFLESAKLKRDPADVFAEPSAMQKLELAELKQERGVVQFENNPESLDKAVLNHLWGGYVSQRSVLKNWVKVVLQSPELNDEELHLVAQRVVDLAVDHTDRELFQALRDNLTGEHRSLAVKVLTEAALSSSSGNYMRDQLYNWAAQRSSPDQLTLVAEICGGELGERMPRIASTRLRRVAANADFGFPPLRDAFASLLDKYPDLATPLRKWLSESSTDRGRQGVLVALAASEPGSRALLGETAEYPQEDSYQRTLSATLRFLISNREAGLHLHNALEQWGERVKADHFPEYGEKITNLLADVYSSPILHSVSRAYKGEDPYWQDVWGRAQEIDQMRSSFPEPSTEPVTEPTEHA
jgi:hypothetical protein